MKRLFTGWLLLLNTICAAQSQEAKQLLLDAEKLTQLKLLLSHMKSGYQVLSKGYTAISNISKGNFNLHKYFLDGLLQVSPAVKKYKRIGEIIELQLKIVKESKDALREFRTGRQFTVSEIEYMGKVYGNLLVESGKNLEALLMIITAGQLRMTDDERLSAIDTISHELEDQYQFLQEFNHSTALLSAQRESEQREIDGLRKLHGINR